MKKFECILTGEGHSRTLHISASSMQEAIKQVKAWAAEMKIIIGAGVWGVKIIESMGEKEK